MAEPELPAVEAAEFAGLEHLQALYGHAIPSR